MSAHGVINHDQTEPNTLWIGLSIILTTIFILGVVVFSVFFYKSTMSSELTRKESFQYNKELTELRIYEALMQNHSVYTSSSKSTARLSIEDAKAYTINQYSN